MKITSTRELLNRFKKRAVRSCTLRADNVWLLTSERRSSRLQRVGHRNNRAIACGNQSTLTAAFRLYRYRSIHVAAGYGGSTIQSLLPQRRFAKQLQPNCL